MAGVKKITEKLVFGLDIGTRSIVGTVGYLKADKFHVLAQCVREHDTRAMLDGQIHDIAKVGESIKAVKLELEQTLSVKLNDVCIAAAGRVLRTVTSHADVAYEAEKEIDSEDIHSLLMEGVEQAYADFQKGDDTGLKFYCVGYTPMRFYMNDYQIGNLEGHKASKISVDLIATFLPDDVVDGLYKAVEIAGLTVASLTLEPIAAIQVAIPEKFRMLNLALVDVGAGTSDISITKDGTIVAYGMIPTAGDSLTDIVVQHCLVDFDTAEYIKRNACLDKTIEYTDILGLPQTIEPSDVLGLLDAKLDEMTELVADEIKKLNGDKSVAAVFVVGGGGTLPGYTEKLAEKLSLVKERVAIRGQEVMQAIDFENKNPIKDSLMVTPIGICLSFYEQNNNFIFVEFNGERLKLYDNGKLSVSDAAMQVSFANEDLFPKRGAALEFTVGGKARIIRGQQGDSCVITLNDEVADLYTQIGSGDRIKVVPSTKGEDAKATLKSLKEFSDSMHVVINGKKIKMPKVARVNGEVQNELYEIKSGDVIEIDNFYTVEQLCNMLEIAASENILVNSTPATLQTKVYEDFTLDIEFDDKVSFAKAAEEPKSAKTEAPEQKPAETKPAETKTEEPETDEQKPVEPQPLVIHDLHVIANSMPVTMSGKKEYIFVDIFDYITFDLKNPPSGKTIVTKVNGMPAEYMKILNEGDKLEIYWESR